MTVDVARQRLVVDGQEVAVLTDYAIRWLALPDGAGYEPVLYHRGRRVTRSWCLILSANCAADHIGHSANTD